MIMYNTLYTILYFKQV